MLKALAACVILASSSFAAESSRHLVLKHRDLLGLGIDEDTAAAIERVRPGQAYEPRWKAR